MSLENSLVKSLPIPALMENHVTRLLNVSIHSGNVMERRIVRVEVTRIRKCAKFGFVSQTGSDVIMTNVSCGVLSVMPRMTVRMGLTSLSMHVPYLGLVQIQKSLSDVETQSALTNHSFVMETMIAMMEQMKQTVMILLSAHLELVPRFAK